MPGRSVIRTAAALALALAAAPARAGWTQLSSGTPNELFDIDFPVDSITGYAVGGGGVILKTTDGGATWTNVQDPAYTESNLDLHFPVDASTGYVVGGLGRILKTVDGGANWTALAPPVTPNFRGVYFVDNLTGYVVGDARTILKTTDGGNNWTDVSDPATSCITLQDVCFPVDATTGYVVGACILKTTDGGGTWTDVAPAANAYVAVDFPVNVSAGTAVANAPDVISRTTDGGSNWTTQAAAIDVRDVDFADASIGYATLISGLVLKTTDGGVTWNTQYLPVFGPAPNGVCAPDAMTAYVVCTDGAIFKTSDGGGECLVLHPTALGTVNSFTTTSGCSAGSEWDCVNDQAGNAGTGDPVYVDGSSYVRDHNNNTNREMYALANGLIPAGSVVTGIEIRAFVGKSGLDPSVALSYRRVGIDAGYINGPTVVITNACCSIRTDARWSCLNWTPAYIDALEIGITHQWGGAIFLGQIYVLVTYLPAGGTSYRSIGTQADNLYATGNATVAACSTVVTFGGGASLPTNVGLGDKLVIGADTYYVYSRDSATQVTLQVPTSTAHTSAAYAIRRAYNTLQAWEDDRDGNLVGEDRAEVGVCYNDGAFTDALVISGSTTDATHFMNLTVAEGQRHNGQRNTGARIDAQGGWGGSDAITVEDEYTQIEWLEIKGIQDAGNGVQLVAAPAADNSVVSNVFVHSCVQSGNAALRIGAQDVTVRNCLATGGTTYGVALLGGATAAIENCTFVGSVLSGAGVVDAIGTTLSIRNTISVNHPAGNDFVLWSGISYFGSNMYQGVTGFDPGDYQGGNQSPPADLENLLVSLASEDYHLEASGHNAGGTGLDLSSSFIDDIDGQTRLPPWDMGADDDQTATVPGASSPRIIGWREVPPY